jgi:hypothetical protein
VGQTTFGGANKRHHRNRANYSFPSAQALPSRSNRAPTRKNQSVAPNAFAITSGKKPVNESNPNTPVIIPVQALAFPNLAFIIVMLASNTPTDGITIM